MKDWKAIAAGLDTGLSDADVEKITPALDTLEAALRPLSATIPYETEPAFIFEAPPENRS